MSENTTDLDRRATAGQWQSRPVAAMVVRAVLLLCPVGVAALLGLLVSRSLPAPTTTLAVVRGVITAAVSLVAFVALGRAGRRFLPLAVLLRLNLVFPDRAPSRFAVSLRSTNVRKLERFVHEARTTDDAVVLAEKVVTLASALNTHDRRTRGHCERTRALADLIVEELHLPPVQSNQVRWGAFLHDIGKLVVPVEILNKPGKPTPSEWEVLRSHPEAGARLVEPLRAFLGSGVDAVGSHHENFDGTGYPTGRGGEDLPLAARIVSVADAVEVMTAVRAYKRPLSLQAARAELTRKSGTQFDPAVVRAFLNVSRRRIHWSLGMAAWLAELPFLAVLPRTLVQLQAFTGATGAVSPVVFPGLAAGLGAMAVVIPLHPPGPHEPGGPQHSARAASFFTPSPSASPAPSPGDPVIATSRSLPSAAPAPARPSTVTTALPPLSRAVTSVPVPVAPVVDTVAPSFVSPAAATVAVRTSVAAVVHDVDTTVSAAGPTVNSVAVAGDGLSVRLDGGGKGDGGLPSEGP